jgi:hypothetical protein
MIFVALAVAWAVYLIPKALRHHDEVARSRSVDRFSNTMRVLARREPVTARDARLVVTPGSASSTTVETEGTRPSPAQLRTRRETARRATQRRRRVLGVLLLANATVAALAGFAVVGWVWQSVPGGLLVAWLVACRLMVKSEQAAWAPVSLAPAAPANSVVEPVETLPDTVAVERNEQGFDEVAFDDDTADFPAVPADPDAWDPVPVTLPTYVTKPVATRTVRTIDLGEPGAWTSGRTAESAELVREADAAARAARKADDEQQRAVGG